LNPEAPRGSGRDASPPSPYPPGQAELLGLRQELEAEIRQGEAENAEIEGLLEQVRVEVERHQGRRSAMEARLASLEADPAADSADLVEVRDGLTALTRREMLFDSQRQVLEAKQRALAHLVQRLAGIDARLASMGGSPVRPTPVAGVGLAPLAAAQRSSAGNGPATAIRSQEDLRRDIVRRLHDGPAQALANIGLQAEIVERLVRQRDVRAEAEVASLRQLVQQALDATKAFIFEVRPMVLDDLGLGPTVRRIASDRERRSGVRVEVDSRGAEQRLGPDIETALYRSIDEAIAGYLQLVPPAVRVRLDWGQHELVVEVEAQWPRPVDPAAAEAGADASGALVTETPPALLAMMEEKRSAELEASWALHALPQETLSTIAERAQAMGLTMTVHDHGQRLELIGTTAR
jgi:signal transduction histidine kinase